MADVACCFCRTTHDASAACPRFPPPREAAFHQTSDPPAVLTTYVPPCPRCAAREVDSPARAAFVAQARTFWLNSGRGMVDALRWYEVEGYADSHGWPETLEALAEALRQEEK